MRCPRAARCGSRQPCAPADPPVATHRCASAITAPASRRTSCRATRRLLERHGYRVVDVENGLEALRVWHASAPDVALVVTDLVMPGGISGQDLAQRVRAERPDAKFVFTSGYTAQRGGVVSPENFVQKPIASSQLLDTIRKTLDR